MIHVFPIGRDSRDEHVWIMILCMWYYIQGFEENIFWRMLYTRDNCSIARGPGTWLYCDPCCQNETLLCTWSKLSFLVYYLSIHSPIMMVKILKLDNPKRSYAHLPVELWNVKNETMKCWNRLSKFGVLPLGQLPTGSKIIKITPFRLQILI